MSKLLEVKEFDEIIGNEKYENESNYKHLPSEIFEDLKEFIHEFTDDENSDAVDFMRIGVKKPVGDVVTIKNYVGLIQMNNGYQVQVLPKISFDSSDDENIKTKKVFLNMLRSMKDFPSKVFNISNLSVDKMNLYEIFINMYLQEVRQLVKHGLKSAYVTQEDNLKFYKGKLLTNQNIRYNVAHQERFYVSYDEFNLNRPENRLVKSTLLKLQRITSSAENSKSIKQLLTAFEVVDPSLNYEKDFAKVSIDRSTKDYEMLMQWAKVFLFNKSFTTFSGSNQSRALLFPMEQVFESYIAQQVRKHFISSGWNVSAQDSRYSLFETPQKFNLRPDLVLRRNDRTVIMDTKWKSLINSSQKNYGISRDDMYQMYAYSKKYETSEIWLLYPINDEMRNHDEISYDSGDGTIVRVFFIDLSPDNIDNCIEDLLTKIEGA